MKIYTGQGDRGKTGLFSGERVPKSDVRIRAYGEIDELNSVVGGVIAAVPEEGRSLGDELRRIQGDLLLIGARLAVTPGSSSSGRLAEVTEDHIAFLEQAIDRMEEGLPPLKGFILPGGSQAASWAHVARTVCRRSERSVVSAMEEDEDCRSSEQIQRVLVYLNRLSDYLFVLARYLNLLEDEPDILWKE